MTTTTDTASPRLDPDRPRPLANATSSSWRTPGVLTPGPVADVNRRLRAFGLERRTLREQPATSATARRTAALGLLVDDAKTELLAAVADTKETWAQALAEHAVTTADAYAVTVHDLDKARTDVSAAGQALAWLDDSANAGSALRRFTLHPPAQLDGTPWPTVIAALRDDPTHPDPDTPTVQRPMFATSLRDSTASFPTLDMPAPIVKAHKEHQGLLAQHHALGLERRKLEDTRRDVQAQDRRELADSIANGTKDPDDRHASTLDTQVQAIDTQRAALTVDIRDTYTRLRTLLREHRDAWRATIAARHHDAVQAYTTAIAALPATRAALHLTRAAATWLDQTKPDDLGRWTDRPQPAVLAQPFDVLLAQLRRDVAAQHQLADTSTGSDAA
jgi:hypothetical protein